MCPAFESTGLPVELLASLKIGSLVTGLGIEVEPFGIRVVLIEPGDLKTAFNDATDWGDPAGSVYGERIRSCEDVIRKELEKAPGPEVLPRPLRR